MSTINKDKRITYLSPRVSYSDKIAVKGRKQKKIHGKVNEK